MAANDSASHGEEFLLVYFGVGAKGIRIECTMKQILQNLSSGATELAIVPAPAQSNGQLAIRSAVSLVSAGTERMLVEFGRGGVVAKARQQPDKVREVLAKVRTDGLMATVDAVRSKLDQPLPLGYCNVGRVVSIGSGVDGFAVGDRVLSNGKHAEVVIVPRNLCARVPDAVDDESAAFTVLAAIALQGVRLVGPTLGEAVVVTGLGLIGLITVQLLRANGCRVLGVDMNPARLELARQFGAEVVDLSRGEDPLAAATAFSRGRGVDAVLLTASTVSNEPVSQAAKMCRKRGRIVLVGVTGLELSRADFYEKELSFQVSCSYGPGRYDPDYEEKGQDYPVGFVRWTEQRNFEAALDLMAGGALDMRPLVSHRFDIDDAPKAYDLLASKEPSLGILIRYPDADDTAAEERLLARVVRLADESPTPATKLSSGGVVLAVIGAGNYAGRVLIPALKAAGGQVRTVVSGSGVTAVHHGRRTGAEFAATDAQAAIDDLEVNAVAVATRHDSHARYVLASLRAGRHVFVEKPLCLTLDELAEIETQLSTSSHLRLMVGFNRRFAPQVVKMKSLLESVGEPKSFVMTVNAGAIPPEHWTQDLQIGGGRIVGEGCHFIDLLRHLAGSPIIWHEAVPLGRHPALAVASDKVAITLQFADGSVGTIHYLANGHKGFPKERLEVFCAGRVLQLDNFVKLRGWGWPGFSKMNLWRQDKGVSQCLKAFVDAIRGGGASPISRDELLEVARVSIELGRASQ
ncbi:MAG: bi-domain-containing oxidoreductase [Burkholderiaceae bacterium]|nr:bi-domain-containing oxidoreductase [Burkholderiaceae bacterium]